MQNRKRILSVKIKRMHDESPDTSWLGEYANRATSEYSIDRAHSLECSANDPRTAEAKDWLDRIEYRVANSDNGQDFATEDEEQTVETLFKLREELECDCGEHGDMERGQYRYFNGNVENYKGESPADIRKYVRQDYERMESLNAGNWSFIGIRAEADVQTAHGAVIQTISSGGLWGIESDAGDDHIKETIQDELDSLKTELTALGFSKRAIATAFKDVQEEQS